MDQRRKWILVDSSIPRSPNGNRKRVVEVYATPSSYDYPSTSSYHRRQTPNTPSESKIHSLNRLNDRIHRKIAANSFLYSSTSSHIREEEIERPREERREEGERIVDESFRFIDDSNIYASSSRLPPNSLNRIVSHRDSQGEIDAVYERKQRPPDRGASLVADAPQHSQWASHPIPSRPLVPNPPSPSKIPSRTEPPEWHHTGVTHQVPITLTKDRLRRDMRENEERIEATTLTRPVVDHSPRRNIDYSPRRLLDYNSHYASLCPYCSNPIHSGDEKCTVCGAVNTTPLRRLGRNYEYFPPTTSIIPPPRYTRSYSAPDYARQSAHVTIEPYYKRREEILNPRTLNRDSHYWATKRTIPQQNTLLRQQRVADPIYRNYGTADWRRKAYGDMDYHNYPNYRDPGYNLHRTYYRFGHLKPRKSRGHTQRKAVAFALALLSLALVISAGIVLAAINY